MLGHFPPRQRVGPAKVFDYTVDRAGPHVPPSTDIAARPLPSLPYSCRPVIAAVQDARVVDDFLNLVMTTLFAVFWSRRAGGQSGGPLVAASCQT